MSGRSFNLPYPMPLKAIIMLTGTAILIVCGYFFSLFAIHGFSPDFLQINTCVEAGGRWNSKERRCEQVYDLKTRQEGTSY